MFTNLLQDTASCWLRGQVAPKMQNTDINSEECALQKGIGQYNNSRTNSIWEMHYRLVVSYIGTSDPKSLSR